MKSSPDLSIVIITLNEAKRLPRLLDNLSAQSWTDFEIIHVDSASKDQTLALSAQYQKQFANYTIIPMDKQGVSLGRNVGAKQAQGKRLLFLDADTQLSADFLAKSITELNDRQLDVAAVLMSTQSLPFRLKMGYALFNWGIRLTAKWYPTAIGACLFSTTSVHTHIEGFDETITLCEDCHYVLKAAKHAHTRFGVLNSRFLFDARRLTQDGIIKTGLLYLRANVRRFFCGEIRHNEIEYRFDHYRE